MIEIICGVKGKGKTKELLERVNSSVKSASGNVVYLDKSQKHMYELNNKTRIYNISEGIEFLGYKYILKNNKIIVKLRNITKKNFKKSIRMLKLLKDYNYIDNNKYKLLLSGYKGVLSKGNCNNLYYRSVIYDWFI